MKKNFALNSILSAILLISGTHVYGQYAVYDATNNASSQANLIQNTISSVKEGITAIETTSIAGTSISQLAAQVTEYATNAARYVSEMSARKGALSASTTANAKGQEMLAQTAIAVQTERELLHIGEAYNVSDPCSISASADIGTTLNAPTVESVGRGRTGGEAPTQGAANTSPKGRLKDIIDRAEGVKANPAPEIATIVAAASSCQNFTDVNQPNSLKYLACVAAGFRPAQANPYASADVNAKTLFDGPQADLKNQRKRYSIDMTDKDTSAAISAFMRNMNTPIELRTLEAGEYASAAGRRYMAVKDVYDARMSFADRASRRHLGFISQNPATIPSLRDIVAENGDVAKYLNKSVPDWQSKGVSADEVMQIETIERRYGSLEWLSKTDNISFTPGEQLRVSALQNVLLWRLVQETRENGLYLGALIGSQVRNEIAPEMKAAHAAAVK